MNPTVLQALNQGASVITATRRLAYELKSAYDNQQIELGRKVWPTARIMTWDGWMQALWHETGTDTLLSVLNNAQLQQLLCEFIEADLKSRESQTGHNLAALWNIPATARTALDAWQLCHQWRISFSALQTSEQADHAHFGRWATRLYARLSEQNWISPAQLPEQLIAAEIKTKQDALLFGFDHLNVQQLRFIEYYRKQGGGLTRINSKGTASSEMRRYSFDSPKAEWQQIGAWARDKLLNNPQLKIGIITPDTNSIRAVAEQSLREQLTPAYFEHSSTDPFHFSIAGTLFEQPLIKGALACLDLLGKLEFKQLSGIFLSNFWGSESEQLLRAQLVMELRRKLAYRFDLYELIEALSALQKKPDPDNESTRKPFSILLDSLGALQSIKTNNRGRQPLSVWRELFNTCLNSLDWPVSKLDSDEFQALQSWERCLEEWIKLDAVCKPMSLVQALQSLNGVCRELVFQARTRARAPIQIMGILEAAELEFDCVWLAGFDELAWPIIAPANPLIPMSTQIEAGIPAATLSLQTQLADMKTGQLCALSKDIIYSHARIQGDIELDVSPTLPAGNLSDLNDLPAIFSLNEAIREATPPLQIRNDDMGFPYREETARGGTGLVQKQSACPFSAYAKYRLKAEEDDEPRIGMDNLQRGSLLHKILETIWLELKDSSTLCRHIEQDTLGDLIQQHIQTQLNHYVAHSGLGDGFKIAETQRLHALLSEWLNLESQRPPFTVAGTEMKCTHQINGLEINLSLDRVDQIADSGSDTAANSPLLVMDYKSGNCKLKDWEGPRPDQPQLPLYFLALEHNASFGHVDALSFAQVKSGLCQYIGISRSENTLPDINTLEALAWNSALKKDVGEWSQLKPLWEARIGKLVKDYQQGFAQVDPKSIQSCHFCSFGPLCRIHTRNSREEEDVN